MSARSSIAAVVAVFSVAAAGQAPLRVETLPGGAPASARLPTVIALHGRQSDAERFAGFVRRLAPGARIISLRAPAALASGYSWFQSRVAAEDQPRLARELQGAVEALRPRILAERSSCGRPILLGYSQGGVLVLALAAERLRGVAAFVDLAGALPEPYPVKRVTDRAAAPVLSFHGLTDPFVPVEATRTAWRRLEQVGIPVTARELPGGHDPTRQLREEVARALAPLLRSECPAIRPPADAGT